jgi:hypothetical protein
MIGDHEQYTVEASGPQALEERCPERPVLGVTDGHTEDFPVPGAGDAGGDHHCPGHDPAIDAALDVGRIGEHVEELDVIQGPVPERLQVTVELGADPRHLALADPGTHAEGSDEVVDLASRDAVHVGLHHHREQRPVDPPPPLQQRREEAPFAEPGDLQFQIPCLGRQQARTVPIALRGARVGPFVRCRANEGRGLGLDQLLKDPLQRHADGVGHLARLERGEQVGQVRLGEGHRRSPLRDPGKEHVETHAGGSPHGGPTTPPTYTTSRDIPTEPDPPEQPSRGPPLGFFSTGAPTPRRR